MKTILTFIIVFGILVIVHEFGHFFFAKRSGILVREFAIGMGPKIYGHQAKDGQHIRFAYYLLAVMFEWQAMGMMKQKWHQECLFLFY